MAQMWLRLTYVFDRGRSCAFEQVSQSVKERVLLQFTVACCDLCWRRDHTVCSQIKPRARIGPNDRTQEQNPVSSRLLWPVPAVIGPAAITRDRPL